MLGESYLSHQVHRGAILLFIVALFQRARVPAGTYTSLVQALFEALLGSTQRLPNPLALFS